MIVAPARGPNAPRPLPWRPEPARFWVRWVPDAWSGPAEGWTDLARAALGRAEGDVDTSGWPPAGLEDLVYVPSGVAGPTSGVASTLIQLRPGERPPADGWGVYDLLQPLLAGDLEALSALPPGASAVWPLVPGVSDAEPLWRRGLPRLAAAGVVHIQPLVLRLTAADRRWLSERVGEGAFGALFHGPEPSERRFATVAREHGLPVFVARPIAGLAGRVTRNRELAGALALAGELWLRCGRPDSEGQALFRAARWIDETEHDVSALTREGNLDLVPWIAEPSGRLLRELVEQGSTSLIDELQAHYATGGAGA